MKPLYDQFGAYLPAGVNVLDAGCGNGRDRKCFLGKVNSTTKAGGGIEINNFHTKKL